MKRCVRLRDSPFHLTRQLQRGRSGHAEALAPRPKDSFGRVLLSAKIPVELRRKSAHYLGSNG